MRKPTLYQLALPLIFTLLAGSGGMCVFNEPALTGAGSHPPVPPPINLLPEPVTPVPLPTE